MTLVRRLHAPADLAAIDRLYRAVFRVDDTGLNVRLLTAIADNGGAVLGAYDESEAEPVAFGLSLLARDPDAGLYHYSQTVGVAAHREGSGLGRLVKYAQRDAALADGLTTMRWVFDPLHARNAHFNLDVLGGRIRTLRRDYYGGAAPGLDRGEPTDRCTVEWDLHGAAPAPGQAPTVDDVAPGEVHRRGGTTVVGVPASWRAQRATLDPASAAALRESVVAALDTGLRGGLVAVSCVRTSAEHAAYVLVPSSALAGAA